MFEVAPKSVTSAKSTVTDILFRLVKSFTRRREVRYAINQSPIHFIMYNRLGEEGTGVLKSAPFYMVREALFSLDSIEIGFEKA